MTPAAEACHILSLGAGVQSSTLALLAAEGVVTPMPEAAIFADTQAEPAKVYEWLDKLEPMLPFPVHRVSAGSLSDVSTTVRVSRNLKSYLGAAIPAYISQGGQRSGMIHRHCTRDFKIRQIIREAKRVAGKRAIVQWIGISNDEVGRMAPSRDRRIEHRWPLVDLRWNRAMCLGWMRQRGLEPPRSACVFCPFHTDSEWAKLTAEEIAGAADYERRLQVAYKATRTGSHVPFLHRTLVPIDQVCFTNPNQQFTWDNECGGNCGV